MICVIDYGMGNLRSVSKAIEKVGGKVTVSSNPKDVQKAKKLILPGVGAFGDGSRELTRLKLFESLQGALKEGKPTFGICLGMQLLFEESEESPGVKGLGIFPGKVQRFRNPRVKVPHMGWNEMILNVRKSPAFQGIGEKKYFYFVHSFYPVPREKSIIWASTKYGDEEFSSFVGKENIWASQFHPEKSQLPGLQILKNFITL